MSDNKYNPEESLKRARAAMHKDSADDMNGIRNGILRRIFNPISSFGQKALQTAVYAYEKGVLPVARFLQPAGRAYVNLFSKVVHKTDPETGARTFKPLRAIGMGAATAAMAFGIVTQAVPFTADLAYDGVFMATTMKHEQMYMNGSHPLDADGKQFYARGCSQLPCESDGDSTYYMLRDNTYLDVKYLFTKGRTYLPELVQSSIPDGFSVCKVSSYGIRNRFPRMYRNIIEAECRPLTVQESNALQEGKVLTPHFSAADAATPAQKNMEVTSPAAPAANMNGNTPALHSPG